MSTNVVNQTAYLRTSREFPEDVHQLTVEVNKAYVDTAAVVNTKETAIYPVSRPAINAQQWFLVANQRQQGLRQVYTFTSVATPINHGINLNTIANFTPRCYGTYNDGTFSYGLIYGNGNGVTVTGQIVFYLSTTQILFAADAMAPTVTSGFIVLEWISAP